MANKFTPFRPGKLGDLDSSYTQKILYANLPRTVISSFVNKNHYYYIVIFIIPVLCFPFCL